jgi:hypothetical protein
VTVPYVVFMRDFGVEAEIVFVAKALTMQQDP